MGMLDIIKLTDTSSYSNSVAEQNNMGSNISLGNLSESSTNPPGKKERNFTKAIIEHHPENEEKTGPYSEVMKDSQITDISNQKTKDTTPNVTINDVIHQDFINTETIPETEILQKTLSSENINDEIDCTEANYTFVTDVSNKNTNLNVESEDPDQLIDDTTYNIDDLNLDDLDQNQSESEKLELLDNKDDENDFSNEKTPHKRMMNGDVINKDKKSKRKSFCCCGIC